MRKRGLSVRGRLGGDSSCEKRARISAFPSQLRVSPSCCLGPPPLSDWEISSDLLSPFPVGLLSLLLRSAPPSTYPQDPSCSSCISRSLRLAASEKRGASPTPVRIPNGRREPTSRRKESAKDNSRPTPWRTRTHIGSDPPSTEQSSGWPRLIHWSQGMTWLHLLFLRTQTEPARPDSRQAGQHLRGTRAERWNAGTDS